MRFIFLKRLQTFFLDVLAWLIFHLGIGFASSKIPLKWLNPNSRLFKTYAWEKEGRVYERIFRVRAWKHLIPNGSGLYRDGFSIRTLESSQLDYLKRWLKKTIRAEICHWLMIVPSVFFFLWNDVLVGWIMVAYAFLNNLPIIIIQRYNRPRIRKLIELSESKNLQRCEVASVYVP